MFFKTDNVFQNTTWSCDINITLTLLMTSTRGHSHHFAALFARTDTCLNSCLLSTIKLWNLLPGPLTDFEDISQFKDELFLHLFLN